MIDSISSTAASSFVRPSGGAQLSTEQTELIAQTLAGYDPDSLTQEQAKEIVEVFAEAGIRPGKELEETLATAGFDAKAIGDLAGAPPPPSGGPSTESVEITELVDYLEELLAQFGGESLNEEDKTAVYEALVERFSLNEGDSFLNLTA